MILILSFKRDLHVCAVEQYLKQWKVPFLKYCFTDYPAKSSLSIGMRKNSSSLLLKTETGRHDLNDFTAVWNRRKMLPVADSQHSKVTKNYIEKESEQFIRALDLHTPADIFWLSSIQKIAEADDKSLQLKIASQIGLTVPHTVIGNDVSAVKEMLDQYQQFALKPYYKNHLDLELGPVDTVKKIFYNFFNRALIKKDMIPPYHSSLLFRTQRLDRSEVEKILPSLQACPVIFQEYIPKKLELRITIVGKKVFCCALYSQEAASPEARIDFRADISNIHHEPYSLPGEVERRCLALVKALGLQFGCIDMIVTPEGKYVFLEINPNGQWLWIQDKTRMPIAKAIAELLITHESL